MCSGECGGGGSVQVCGRRVCRGVGTHCLLPRGDELGDGAVTSLISFVGHLEELAVAEREPAKE